MPWWIETSNASDRDDKLCKVCRHISFAWLLHNELPSTDSVLEGRILLGPMGEIVEKRSCGFCRLVTQTVEIFLDRKSTALPNNEKRAHCWLNTSFDLRISNQETHRIGLFLGDESGSTNGFPLGAMDIHLLQPDSPSPSSHLLLRRRIEGPRTDFNLAKKWVELCENTHSVFSLNPNEQVGHLPANFRVIDVQKQCLRQAPSDCKYLALSYLWGSVKVFKTVRKTRSQLEKSGSLSFHNEELPRTIRDAIYLTVQVGQRYLWVDAICS